MTGKFKAEGSRLDATFFDRLSAWVLSRLESGTGIQLSRMNGKIIINATGVGGARGGGSGGLSCPWVTDLPPIPTAPDTTLFVFWASSARKTGGTGDDGVWCASTGDTRWYPVIKYTSEDGIPES